jgi:peptidoglycan/xylan/chitin deacetylase (PgdA/CDA1 family)
MRRREFLRRAALAAAVTPSFLRAQGTGNPPAASLRKAMIALTVNLEMSRNFPTRDQTHWDYEKGNLDEDNKRYAVELGRFIKQRGALANYFVVGQVLEHESVTWLEELHQQRHVIGNHTYDHVNLVAAKPEDLQFRYRRAPWLVEGKTAEQVVEENIRMTNAALRHRLGIQHVRGFRSSNEYPTGLDAMPRMREMLRRLGFDWVGTKFAPVRLRPLERASETVFNAVVESQARTQPYLYPSGLVEIPKSALSDITAFRTGRWGIGDYLEATRRATQWAIDNRRVLTFTVHSSVQVVVDPEFKVFELLFDLVAKSGDRAEFVTLDQIADRLRAGKPPV